MKKYLVAILLMVCIFNAFSQCVSIELSIEWKKTTKKNNKKYNLSCNPYLNITYQNNSLNPLYFLKISSVAPDEFPSLGGDLTYVHTYDDLNKLDEFSNNKYYVIIGGSPYTISDWEVFSDTADYHVEHTNSVVHNVLSSVYEYILNKKFYKNNKILITEEYNATDITEYGIFNKLRDDFVFLKAGEKHTDSYNLIGFQLVGGDYCFMVKPDSLSNFVYTDSFWDKNQAKWEYRMTPLPAKVKEYNLFSGMVITNNVSVRFTRPQKK